MQYHWIRPRILWCETLKIRKQLKKINYIWTFREIKKGEQLYIFYGDDYSRAYPINRDDNACGEPNRFNFSVFSQTCDPKHFVMEECPGWMCEIINNCEASWDSGSILDVWKASQHAKQLRDAQKHKGIHKTGTTTKELGPFEGHRDMWLWCVRDSLIPSSPSLHSSLLESWLV